MKKNLGIDFGLSKIGLAISVGFLIEPYSVVRYTNLEIVFKNIKEIIAKERIEKIIVGISEGEMTSHINEFINKLKKEIDIPIETFDETLSTQDAQRMAIESGMKRSKRKDMEDAMAAAVMLQGYMDQTNIE